MLAESLANLETLPAFCKARILILGVGNVLFGDDGFGPAVVERLANHYIIPDDMYVMDVGTGVRKMLFTLTLSAPRPEEIVVVDAVDWGLEIGRVSEIPVEDLPPTKTDDFSLHHAPTSNLLRDLQEQCGVRVTVIACDVGHVPQMIQPGLSTTTRQAVAIASQGIAKRYLLLPAFSNG